VSDNEPVEAEVPNEAPVPADAPVSPQPQEVDEEFIKEVSAKAKVHKGCVVLCGWGVWKHLVEMVNKYAPDATFDILSIDGVEWMPSYTNVGPARIVVLKRKDLIHYWGHQDL
jgi:hypothetical protein